MERLTTTPFGRRPVTAGLLATQALASRKPETSRYSKWQIFRNLCTARAAFDISNRDLTVLNALLTFHRGNDLADGQNLIVFPSNATLAERAHGMAESTLRRHLAALATAGLILRHDSPNGKRYAKRDSSGTLIRAFGFDLRPLLIRAREIEQAATAAKESAERIRQLRERVALLIRDTAKLLDYRQSQQDTAACSAHENRLIAFRKALRRKLTIAQLQELLCNLEQLLAAVQFASEPDNLRADGSKNERHHQSSIPDLKDSEPVSEPRSPETTLSLALVLKACPELLVYSADPVASWHQFVAAAACVRRMMGITSETWAHAQETMGTIHAAITVACILQNYPNIANPGGYLRSLAIKAASKQFSSTRAVMALLNAPKRRAA